MICLTFLTASWAGGTAWNPPDLDANTLRQLSTAGLVARILWAGLPYGAWVIAILLSHEMGHYLACRYHGIRATLPFFLPAPPPLLLGTFGAVIRIRSPIPNRRALFDVAAAGPLAGFVMTIVPLCAGLWGALPAEPEPGTELSGLHLGQPLLRLVVGAIATPHEWIQVNGLYGAAWVGMLVTSLNLFPVGQLDGGHALYALSRGTHRFVSRATLLAMLFVLAYQVHATRQVPVYTLWFAILLWMRDRHPRLIDETESVGGTRSCVALLLLLVFVLCFMFNPLYIVSG